MTDLRARLVSFSSAGVRGRALPAPFEWSCALPLNDLPSLTVSYTRLAPGGALLAGQTEVGLEVSTDRGKTWSEPLGGRFLATAETGDDADTARKLAPQLKGIAYHLAKALVYPAAVPTADNTTENNERIFAGATPGAILKTLLDEAHARGTIIPLTTAATAAVDSAGQAWTEEISLNFPVGQDLMTVLRSLSEQGMVDWTTQGRALQLYKPDTVLGRDKTSVILRTGRDTTEASRQSTVDDVANAILLLGDDGLARTLSNPEAPSMFGAVWETTDSMAGVSDEGSQDALAQAILARRNGPRISRSRQLALPKLPYAPLADFRTGDTISADGVAGLEPQRIMQLTLSMNTSGIGCAVTLNDRFLVGDLKRERQISQIRGSSGGTGGNGAIPGPIGPDTRTPQQVVGLTSTSASYIDASGNAQAQITLAWAQVTAATDGAAQVIAAYYIERRPAGGEWSKVAEVLDPLTVWTSSPYDPGSLWEFRVQALSAGWVLGAFSTTAEAEAAEDTTPPPVPDQPFVQSRLGVASVGWNGAPDMPADFARIDVAVGVSPTPEIVTGALSRPGTMTVTGLTYGLTYYARFRSVDRSGNVSAWTASTAFLVKPLVDTDLIGEIIDGAHIVDGTINAVDKVIANTITGDLIQANTITGDLIQANTITGDLIQANTIEGGNLKGNAIDGFVITGAVIQTYATGQRQVMDYDGYRAYNIVGAVVTSIDNATGAFVTQDGTIVGTFRNGPVGSNRIEISREVGYADRIGYVSSSNVRSSAVSFLENFITMAGQSTFASSTGGTANLVGALGLSGVGRARVLGGGGTGIVDISGNGNGSNTSTINIGVSGKDVININGDPIMPSGQTDYDTGEVAFPFASGYAQFDAGANSASVWRNGWSVGLSGLVKPASGNFAANTTVTIGTLSSGFWPGGSRQFMSVGVTGGTYATAWIFVSSNGIVQVRPSVAVPYISLSPATWRAA